METQLKTCSSEAADLGSEYVDDDSSSNSDFDLFPWPAQEPFKNFYFHNNNLFRFFESHPPLPQFGDVVFPHVMDKSISITPFNPDPLPLPPSTTTVSLSLFDQNYYVHGTDIFSIYCKLSYPNSASKLFHQMPNIQGLHFPLSSQRNYYHIQYF